MLKNQRLVPFLAFTAVFAALAGFVFWGTWSMDFVPVMPDHPTTFAADSAARALNRFFSTGKFIPGDLVDFVGSPYFWLELKYVLALYCAALGVAYFCRGRGLPPLASYGAGLLLAFSGYWMTLFSAGHYGWFQWMTYGVFAFGLVDRAVEGNRLRHWLLLGLLVSWAGFNQQDLWLFFTVFTAAYFVFRCCVVRKCPWKGALVAAVAFALVGLPNFKDVFANTIKSRAEQMESAGAKAKDTAGAADDSEKRWEFVTNWSLPPEDTAEFVVPGVHGDTSCPFVLSIGRRLASGVTPYLGRLGRPLKADSGNYRQHSLYLGVVFCLLALWGVVSGVRGLFNRTIEQSNNRTVLFFAVAALVFYLLSLGRFFAPAYRLIFALPFGDMIRCPVKWHHLTEFCLAILAGYGIAGLLAEAKRLGRAAPWAVGALVLVGALDLARVDRRYCAPYDVSAARRTNCGANLTFLQTQQLQNPQVAEMVRQKKVVSVARFFANPDVYLVEVLQPFSPEKPVKPTAPVLALGLVSLVCALGISAYALQDAFRNRKKT